MRLQRRSVKHTNLLNLCIFSSCFSEVRFNTVFFIFICFLDVFFQRNPTKSGRQFFQLQYHIK